MIARHLRACSEQDLTYGKALFILSQPARACMWRTLTRFSSAWVCSIRVNANIFNEESHEGGSCYSRSLRSAQSRKWVPSFTVGTTDS